MYIPRAATRILKEMAKGFPVLAITGPRQSGKTTLAKKTFPQKDYVSLEHPGDLEWAQDDPEGFLDRFPKDVILDEVQRCPELFSYIQIRVDEKPKMGKFILTGSQQFGLNERISQSLAGRVGNLVLLPFSFTELKKSGKNPRSLDSLLWKGLYPPLYDRKLKPGQWLASYVNTYLERDLRQIISVRDLRVFQRFLKLCAGRTGQLLNHSSLAGDCGVDRKTIGNWLSILEASHIVFLLPPHHQNFRKRLVKSPKIYFLDPGLAAFLIGIENASQIATHPARGALFETWIVSEVLKSRMNRAKPSNLFFWRDNHGHEVDLILEKGSMLDFMEIKSAITVRKSAIEGLGYWRDLAGSMAGKSFLITGGEMQGKWGEVDLVPWKEIGKIG